MANVFSLPKNIIGGKNAMQESMQIIKPLGKKALLVTDKRMIDIGYVEKLTDELDKIKVKYEIFAQINSEPDSSNIVDGVKVYKENKCDFIISLGGGSPIDAMKAIGIIISNGGKISDYTTKEIKKILPPTVAIPTTAGTGSEATRFSIIINKDTGRKMLLQDPKLMPHLAVIDPAFTLTVPADTTVSTGLEAFTHAIESYISKSSSSMSDLYAVSAIKRIFNNIHEAYTQGYNLTYRAEMAMAAFEAGVSFNNTSASIIHKMGQPMNAVYGIPHGELNGILLSVCLKYIENIAQDKLCELAKAIGCFGYGMTVAEGAQAFVEKTIDLLGTLNVKTIPDYDIDILDFFQKVPKMSEDVVNSDFQKPDDRLLARFDVENLYAELWTDSGEYR